MRSMLAAIAAAYRWATAPDLTHVQPTEAAAPCLRHDGSHCARCRQDGRSMGYVTVPATVEGWTTRAHDARFWFDRATSAVEREAYAHQAALAWVRVIDLTRGLQRTAAIDEAVREYLRAGRPEEAALLVVELVNDASDGALWSIGARGEALLERRLIQREIDHQRHAAAVIEEVANETGWQAWEP